MSFSLSHESPFIDGGRIPGYDQAIAAAIRTVADEGAAISVIRRRLNAFTAEVAWESRAARSFRDSAEHLTDGARRLNDVLEDLREMLGELAERSRAGTLLALP